MHCKTLHALTAAIAPALVLILVCPAAGQGPAGAGPETGTATGQQAVADTAADRAQLENYVRVMKSELERAEARASAVTAQLVSLDDDIESRVNRIVSLLASVRDSTDESATRIRKAKMDALAGLEATAKYYAQERDKRRREMGNRNAQISDDELARDVAALNARIETRVTQSLDIASSLAQAGESPAGRYENLDTDYSRETSEYRNEDRDARASVKIKADLAAELRASIDKLTRDRNALEAEQRTTADPQRKEQLSADIETISLTIEARRSQLEQLVTAPQAATRPVGRKGAFELDKMIDEMTEELRKDFVKFKSLVIERDAARSRVKPLQARLERAAAALAEMNAEPAPAK